MKKNFIGPLITIIILILLAAMFVYFYVQINRMDKKIIANQTTTSKDTAQISQIVTFINSGQTAATASTNASVTP
jgi:CHASE3 domain sensor protein